MMGDGLARHGGQDRHLANFFLASNFTYNALQYLVTWDMSCIANVLDFITMQENLVGGLKFIFQRSFFLKVRVLPGSPLCHYGVAKSRSENNRGQWKGGSGTRKGKELAREKKGKKVVTWQKQVSSR